MHRHFLIHKPHGYLSQFIYEKKRPKKLLGELYHFPEGTMAIGRLDEDSEGLLLLTTDGMISEIVRSKTVEKEYYAQVDGIINEEAITQIKKVSKLDSKESDTQPKNVNLKSYTNFPKALVKAEKFAMSVTDQQAGFL
jgi:23S rRNA pseudouridine2457 synthase